MYTVLRLDNGYYRVGRRIVTFGRAKRMLWQRGFRFMSIVDSVSKTLVDFIDLA